MIGKLILGLGSIAGGTLASLRLAEEVVEFRKLGPPAWWAIWWHPVGKKVEAPPPSVKGVVSLGTKATRVYRWDRDRWVSLTPFVYDLPTAPDAAKRVYVSKDPPSERSLYAQVWWSRKLADGPWSPAKVQYAANAANKLPR